MGTVHGGESEREGGEWCKSEKTESRPDDQVMSRAGNEARLGMDATSASVVVVVSVLSAVSDRRLLLLGPVGVFQGCSKKGLM